MTTELIVTLVTAVVVLIHAVANYLGARTRKLDAETMRSAITKTEARVERIARNTNTPITPPFGVPIDVAPETSERHGG